MFLVPGGKSGIFHVFPRGPSLQDIDHVSRLGASLTAAHSFSRSWSALRWCQRPGASGSPVPHYLDSNTSLEAWHVFSEDKLRTWGPLWSAPQALGVVSWCPFVVWKERGVKRGVSDGNRSPGDKRHREKMGRRDRVVNVACRKRKNALRDEIVPRKSDFFNDVNWSQWGVKNKRFSSRVVFLHSNPSPTNGTLLAASGALEQRGPGTSAFNFTLN